MYARHVTDGLCHGLVLAFVVLDMNKAVFVFHVQRVEFREEIGELSLLSTAYSLHSKYL